MVSGHTVSRRRRHSAFGELGGVLRLPNIGGVQPENAKIETILSRNSGFFREPQCRQVIPLRDTVHPRIVRFETRQIGQLGGSAERGGTNLRISEPRPQQRRDIRTQELRDSGTADTTALDLVQTQKSIRNSLYSADFRHADARRVIDRGQPGYVRLRCQRGRKRRTVNGSPQKRPPVDIRSAQHTDQCDRITRHFTARAHVGRDHIGRSDTCNRLHMAQITARTESAPPTPPAKTPPPAWRPADVHRYQAAIPHPSPCVDRRRVLKRM